MANRYSLNQVNLIRNRKVFFDANVLIYLFWPSGRYYLESSYSKVFSSLKRQSNELFVDFLVISEIINRAHRIEYEKYLKSDKFTQQPYKYKKFRESTEGQDALSDIYLIVKENILKTFSIIGKSFNKDEIENFLSVESLDFVDKAILKICLENNYVLCTNDSDFKNSNVDILSSNQVILNTSEQ